MFAHPMKFEEDLGKQTRLSMAKVYYHNEVSFVTNAWIRRLLSIPKSVFSR